MRRHQRERGDTDILREITQRRMRQLRHFSQVHRRERQPLPTHAPAQICQRRLLIPEFRRLGKLGEDIGIVARQRNAAVWQMDDPGGIVQLDWKRNAEHRLDECMGTSGLETARDRRARLEAITLMEERPRAATRIALRFQDGDAMPCLGEQRCGGQPANASANDDNVLLLCRHVFAMFRIR